LGPLSQIERVVVLPRRMLGRDVERGEIVEIGLDVWPLGDRESHIGEDLGDLVGHLAHRMDAPLGERALTHGKRDVGALDRQLLAERSLGKLAALGLERLANTLLQAIDDLAVSLALLRRKRAERLHQLRDASLSPERGDAHLFELVEVVSLGDGVKQLGLETVELWRAQ